MNKNKILKILDLVCYSLTIVGALLVVIFEFVGNFNILKFGVIFFTVSLFLLTALQICRLIFSYKLTKENNSYLFLEKKEKVLISLKLIFFVIAFCWMIFILINFN